MASLNRMIGKMYLIVANAIWEYLTFIMFCTDCNSTDIKPDPGALSASTPTHNTGQSTTSELGSGQKPGSKVVYVFTTEMANK